MPEGRKTLVQRGQSRLTATPVAHEAAARIRALHMTARTFAQLIEAQIMEALWAIRRELPVDAEFDAFVESQTPIDRRRARLMVETWAVARRRRELRELAQRQPSEALSLMQSAIDAGVQLADATDHQVTELLSRPPRQRNRAIRELIESHRTNQQSATSPVQERGVEKAGESAPAGDHPNRRLAGLVEALQAIESELADLLMNAEMVLGAGAAVPEAGRERLLSLAALATDHIERIHDLALSSDAAATRGGPQ